MRAPVFVAACVAASTLSAQSAPPAQAPEVFDPPVRLQASGAWIDTGEHVAHAGPLLADLDGDGDLDLLVGNFRGHIQVYRNTGTPQQPAFEAEGLLEAGGEPIRIHNW